MSDGLMSSVPVDGSMWVWDLTNDYSRQLISVIRVIPSNVGVMVKYVTLPIEGRPQSSVRQVRLETFWRSVTPVGKTLAEMSELRDVSNSTEGTESC